MRMKRSTQMEPMKQFETGSFIQSPEACACPGTVRIVSWNINRGQLLKEVIEFLAGTPADLVLLQEADLFARRTHYCNVAREIAQSLEMNYVFGYEFEELAQGQNGTPAYHGQATLSRLPLSHSRVLRFHRQSNFWHPRWFIPRVAPFQRRVGGRMALISCVDLPEQKLIVYNVHLESRGSDDLRRSQLAEILDDVSQQPSDVQVVITGDFNADLRREPIAAVIGESGLNIPFAHRSSLPTTVPSRFKVSRTIDWILTKGPLIASEATLHDAIRASDHYPLTLTLRHA
jgi:endonuclease/exonuclease/phosphatase family metal-dependent hydrolase